MTRQIFLVADACHDQKEALRLVRGHLSRD